MANVSQGTAQIFKFPPRGRFAVGGNETAPINGLTSRGSSQAVLGALSSAWYHEEAVREAEPTRKN